MKTVSILDAKDRPTELARAVEGGESFVVTENGQPVYDLVPHRRRGGIDLRAGAAHLASRGIAAPVPFIAEDFDAPLADDVLLRAAPSET